VVGVRAVVVRDLAAVTCKLLLLTTSVAVWLTTVAAAATYNSGDMTLIDIATMAPCDAVLLIPVTLLTIRIVLNLCYSPVLLLRVAVLFDLLALFLDVVMTRVFVTWRPLANGVCCSHYARRHLFQSDLCCHIGILILRHYCRRRRILGSVW